MKKKKVHRSEDSLPGQQSADYVVGQVSGSLLDQNSAASGSLSALFSTTSPAAAPLFQPASKLVQKRIQSEQKQQESSERKDELKQKNKKPPRKRSAADRKLQNRESSLQEADDDEMGQEHSAKKKRSSLETVRENQEENWAMKRQMWKAGRQEENLKSQRTVFVGNLPISCTKKMLWNLFRDKGPIESVRFRSVVREDPSLSRKLAVIRRSVHPQKQSLNAYVVFKDQEAVVKALERNGMEIEKDFYIRVDRVTDSSPDHRRSVFVGNLPFDIKEAAFQKHFEKCGAVEGVRLVRDRNSGLGKGFGYVLFESADSVQLALELDGSKLEGRSVRVKRSVKKETPTKQTCKSPLKGSGQRRAGPGGFRSPKRLPGNQQTATKTTSFKGEMVNPKKTKKKRVKKANRSVHL